MDVKTKLYVTKKNDNDLVTIPKSEVTLRLNKSAYAGMCILDLREMLMHELHYDYIKNTYGNNSRLFFTDTDSFMYEIKTEDVYEDYSQDKKMFDFSSYSARSKYYDDSSKVVAGKLKDETGVVIVE